MEEQAASHRPSTHDVEYLSRLAGGLAHEIKNPLSTMAINLTLLEEEWERAGAARNPEKPERTPREERSLKRIRTLQREVRRLEHILQEFLNYARGGLVNRKPEDLARIVRELVEFVEPEDEQAGIRHHVDLPVGLPLVLVDEDQIKQAVLNLLVNARHAMPDGGELIVQVRRVGNQVELTVTDTGIGMQPEHLERCFDEYWSSKKGGTGLGLSTANRIIQEHAGTITVISEPGRGTAFSVYLPLAVELTAPRTREEARPASPLTEDAVVEPEEREEVEG
jgi:signal transduction histidine kinase